MKAPGFGDNKRANLEDLAILTGGEVRQNLRAFTFLWLVYLLDFNCRRSLVKNKERASTKFRLICLVPLKRLVQLLCVYFR